MVVGRQSFADKDVGKGFPTYGSSQEANSTRSGKFGVLV